MRSSETGTGAPRPRIGIMLILAAYVVLGVIYSLVTPLFEASDEMWHYPFVKHLADGNVERDGRERVKRPALCAKALADTLDP